MKEAQINGKEIEAKHKNKKKKRWGRESEPRHEDEKWKGGQE